MSEWGQQGYDYSASLAARAFASKLEEDIRNDQALQLFRATIVAFEVRGVTFLRCEAKAALRDFRYDGAVDMMQTTIVACVVNVPLPVPVPADLDDDTKTFVATAIANALASRMAGGRPSTDTSTARHYEDTIRRMDYQYRQRIAQLEGDLQALRRRTGCFGG